MKKIKIQKIEIPGQHIEVKHVRDPNKPIRATVEFEENSTPYSHR